MSVNVQDGTLLHVCMDTGTCTCTCTCQRMHVRGVHAVDVSAQTRTHARAYARHAAYISAITCQRMHARTRPRAPTHLFTSVRTHARTHAHTHACTHLLFGFVQTTENAHAHSLRHARTRTRTRKDVNSNLLYNLS